MLSVLGHTLHKYLSILVSRMVQLLGLVRLVLGWNVAACPSLSSVHTAQSLPHTLNQAAGGAVHAGLPHVAARSEPLTSGYLSCGSPTLPAFNGESAVGPGCITLLMAGASYISICPCPTPHGRVLVGGGTTLPCGTGISC